ncbi:MAG: hydroxymethylbilane synthase [Bacteroidia bacterium]
MSQKITIGTRGSELALWQANFTKNNLEKLGVEVELNIIKTQGDKIQNLSFDKMEGKGFFTKEIEEALLSNQIDLAVHSHKDLETTPPEGLAIAAVSYRENPADVLLIRKEAVDETQTFSIKKNAVVGTSSARRKNQLLFFREDISLNDLRGNVPTRIQKLRDGNYDAIMLAKAGVDRLQIDLSEFHEEELSPKEFIPAPAQGVLAYQIRKNDNTAKQIISQLNHNDVAECIYVERTILNRLDGGCQLPLGAYCEKIDNEFHVWVSAAKDWQSTPVRLYRTSENAEELVNIVLSDLKKKVRHSASSSLVK